MRGKMKKAAIKISFLFVSLLYCVSIVCAAQPALKWKTKLGNSITSCPAIGEDGTVYVVVDGRYLYAVNPDGTVKWRNEYPINTVCYEIYTTPVIGSDGTIYIGGADFEDLSDQRYIYAIDPSGSLKWRYRIENSSVLDAVVSSPSLDSNNILYYNVSWTDIFGALNPDGSSRWVGNSVTFFL